MSDGSGKPLGNPVWVISVAQQILLWQSSGCIVRRWHSVVIRAEPMHPPGAPCVYGQGETCGCVH